MDDPYSFDLTDFKLKAYLGFAVTDPRAQAKVMPISWEMQRDLVRVLDDPARRWATSWRAWWRQVRDIVLHEYWVAAGRPSRSPGARWITAEEAVR